MGTANSDETANELLSSARTVLLIDWPSIDVPNALAACGLQVHVKNGPAETDFAMYTVRNGQVERQPTGRAPDRVDFIYVHRPIAEMPGIIDMARRTSARAIWFQSGRNPAGHRDERGCWMDQSDSERLAELTTAAGLICVAHVYIGEVARNK